jgi:large subunit ribosomal protein L15
LKLCLAITFVFYIVIITDKDMYSFTVEMSPLNLDKIQDWIDQGRLDPSQPITIKELSASRCLHGIKDGVKLLARGADILRSPIHILVSRASTAAIAAIEARGGSVTTRYYTRQSIKRVLAGEAENSWMPLPGKLSEVGIL